MSKFKAQRNSIIESETGQQVAVVLPVTCTKKATCAMAAYAAQQMNHDHRAKTLQKKGQP